MDNEQTKKTLIRWSCLALIVTTLFWTIWSFTVGPVPMQTHFCGRLMPFGIELSRWWDVPASLFYVLAFVFSFRFFISSNKKDKQVNEFFGFILISSLAPAFVPAIIETKNNGLLTGCLISIGFLLLFFLASCCFIFISISLFKILAWIGTGLCRIDNLFGNRFQFFGRRLFGWLSGK